MTITAEVILDSQSPYSSMFNANRIITFRLRYPRFIHAELMTHRVFSRNASSSRAIPVKRLISDLKADTAMPIHWGKNQPGMQANEEHNAPVVCPFTDEELTREEAWDTARDAAVMMADAFDKAGYHKQIVNRLLEPFSHINVVVTATNYANWFWLRSHADAQPEIKALSDAMLAAMEASTPTVLKEGEWHLPFITDRDRSKVFMTMGRDGNVIEDEVTVDDLLKVSVARCARVSYFTHDGGDPDFEKDLELYDRLVGSAPLHASPAEHQAKPDEPIFVGGGVQSWGEPHLSGNLDEGWVQFRKTLPGECCDEYPENIAA